MNNDTVPLQKSEGKIDKVFETSDNTEYASNLISKLQLCLMTWLAGACRYTQKRKK